MNPKAVKRVEEEGMKNFGFYMHFVIDAIDCPNQSNIHTHGLPKSFNHPDLQLCFPLPEQIAASLIHSAVNLIRSGIRLETDIFYEGIMNDGYKVQFIKTTECDRPVLRMIVPDKNHKYNSHLSYLEQFF